MKGNFYSLILYPLYHALKRDGFNKAVRVALSNEALADQELMRLQQKKLQSILRHAIDAIPYYKSFKAYDNSAELKLSDFPVIDKKVITENFEDFQWPEAAEEELLDNSTSGSSGISFKFKTDIASQAARMAYKFINHSWLGISRSDRKVWLWGAALDLSSSQTIRGKVRSWVTGEVYLDSGDLSDQQLEKYYHFIRKFSPALITSYPGPMYEFALFCQKNKYTLPSLRAIISSAEMLYPYQRELIESVFLIRVANRYGSREFGDMALEDHTQQGMRINAGRVFIEVLDEELCPCAYGEEGDIVVTDLDNFGMPMIRYRLGDRGILLKNKSNQSPRLASVTGRSMDVIKMANGKKVGGTFWTLLMRKKPGIRQFQMRQVSPNKLIVYYSKDEQFSEGLLEYLNSKIQLQLGGDVDVQFELLESFPLPANGKHRIIINETPS